MSAKDLKPSLVSAHYSTSANKAVLHRILWTQDGVLNLMLPNRFYLLGDGTLAWCGQDGVCKPFQEF